MLYCVDKYYISLEAKPGEKITLKDHKQSIIKILLKLLQCKALKICPLLSKIRL